MIDAKELARAGCKYLGTSYSTMDCQAFWERMLSDCGLHMDLGGSNSWYRYMMDHGWVGTPEECVAEYGCVPQGATLFIWREVCDKTPEKFRHDGIGDIYHMGDYTAMTGAEMCQIASESGVKNADQYNYGDGAIHSSESRGGVRTSKFKGKTIPNGGWNRVGLFLEKISYSGISPEPGPGPGPEPQPEKAEVWSPNGGVVHMRQKPTKSCGQYWDLEPGTIVDVLETGCGKNNDWSKVGTTIINTYAKGYIMDMYLRPVENPQPIEQMYSVTVPGLSYDEAKNLTDQYPDAWMTPEESVGGG